MIRRKDGRPTAYAMACGYVDTYGPHVSVSMEHGTYHIKRHPEHPEGHAHLVHQALGTARKWARALASGRAVTLDVRGDHRIEFGRALPGAFPLVRFYVVLPSGMRHGFETESKAKFSAYWPAP